MMKLWDYFMRRKVLLVLTVVLFAASGFLSYKALNINIGTSEPSPQYIKIADWGNGEVAIPSTGGLTPFVAVMQPGDVVALVEPEVSNEAETLEPTEVLTDDIIPEEVAPEQENDPAEREDSDEQIANEDLDNLEPLRLPDSVVMEVLPPDQQMSDEVLDSAIDALAQATRSDAEPATIVGVSLAERLDLATIIMIAIVLGLGGHLTYWHFRR